MTGTVNSPPLLSDEVVERAFVDAIGRSDVLSFGFGGMTDRWIARRGLEAAGHAATPAAIDALLDIGEADTGEAASLFYYLNRTAYNGLCRFNRRGEFNVPFGRYKTIAYRRDFAGLAEAFAGWEFTAGDFGDVPLRDDDFVYADPPYDVEFTAYARGGFTWDDQQRTAELLARHPGPVVLVNQATARIERLYRGLGYTLNHLTGPRRISCNGDRRPAREVMATRHL